MPQMNKGGKFIFGKSLIRTDGTLRIPPQAMKEYHIADEGKVYLFTGSKITGGFCVTRKGQGNQRIITRNIMFYLNCKIGRASCRERVSSPV